MPDMLAFIRRPYLISVYERMSSLGMAQLVLLLALELLVVGLMSYGPVAEYQEAMGIADPEIFEDESFAFIVFELVILAPLIEETLFRGWLKGSWRGLVSLAYVSVWFIVLFLIYNFGSRGPGQAAIFLVITAIIFISCVLTMTAVRHRREAPVFFNRHFAVIFWVSALCFGLIHIFNYEHHSYVELIPMIVTQAIGGLTLGYVRLRYGLVYAMLQHGAFNGLLLLW